MIVEGHKAEHPWNAAVRLGLLRAAWKKAPAWEPSSSVDDYLAAGGLITRCAPGAVPEVLESEDCPLASEAWELRRRLTHTADSVFLTLGDWVGTTDDALARRLVIDAKKAELRRHGFPVTTLEKLAWEKAYSARAHARHVDEWIRDPQGPPPDGLTYARVCELRGRPSISTTGRPWW